MLFERNDMLTMMTVEYRDENDNPIGESETIRFPSARVDLSLRGIDMLKLPLTPEMRPGRKQSAGWTCRAAFGRRRNADADARLSGKADSAGWKADGSRCVRSAIGRKASGTADGRQRAPQRLAGLDIIHADADKIFVDENGSGNISSANKVQEDGFCGLHGRRRLT
ncbi:MAG: hypothetical protein ACLUI3_13515 [Christensenellales bacterium]